MEFRISNFEFRISKLGFANRGAILAMGWCAAAACSLLAASSGRSKSFRISNLGIAESGAFSPWDGALRPLAHFRPRRAAAQKVFEFRISKLGLI
jgi:hypothetical protein